MSHGADPRKEGHVSSPLPFHPRPTLKARVSDAVRAAAWAAWLGLTKKRLAPYGALVSA